MSSSTTSPQKSHRPSQFNSNYKTTIEQKQKQQQQTKQQKHQHQQKQKVTKVSIGKLSFPNLSTSSFKLFKTNNNNTTTTTTTTSPTTTTTIPQFQSESSSSSSSSISPNSPSSLLQSIPFQSQSNNLCQSNFQQSLPQQFIPSPSSQSQSFRFDPEYDTTILSLSPTSISSNPSNHILNLSLPPPISRVTSQHSSTNTTSIFLISPTLPSSPSLSSPSTPSLSLTTSSQPNGSHRGQAIVRIVSHDQVEVITSTDHHPILASASTSKFTHPNYQRFRSTPHLPSYLATAPPSTTQNWAIPTQHTKLSQVNKAQPPPGTQTPPQFIFESPAQIHAKKQMNNLGLQARIRMLSSKSASTHSPDNKPSPNQSSYSNQNPLSELKRFLNVTFSPSPPPRNRAISTNSTACPPPASQLQPTTPPTRGNLFGAKRSLFSDLSPLSFSNPTSARSRKTSNVSSPTQEIKIAPLGLHQKYGKFGKVLGSGAGGTVRLIGGTSSDKKSKISLRFGSAAIGIGTQSSSSSSSSAASSSSSSSLRDPRIKHDQIHAVKQFRSRRRDESEREYLKKITAEFCIGSALHHPNVIRTVEIISERGNYYQVMEYAKYDLFSIVMTGELSKSQIYCMFKQLVRGVHYLHSMGIAHRDLKLENCVMSDDMRIKIIDFGSATVFKYPEEEVVHHRHQNSQGELVGEENEGNEKVIRTSDIVGSDPYLAPEILIRDKNGNRLCDPSLVDIWSIGIIFVCMNLKRFPWKIADSRQDNCFKEFVRKSLPLKFTPISPIWQKNKSLNSSTLKLSSSLHHKKSLNVSSSQHLDSGYATCSSTSSQISLHRPPQQQQQHTTPTETPRRPAPKLKKSNGLPPSWDENELIKEENDLTEQDTLFRLLPKESRLTIARMLRVNVNDRVKLDQLIFENHLSPFSTSTSTTRTMTACQVDHDLDNVNSGNLNQSVLKFNQSKLGWLNSIHICVDQHLVLPSSNSDSSDSIFGDVDHDHVLTDCLSA